MLSSRVQYVLRPAAALLVAAAVAVPATVLAQAGPERESADLATTRPEPGGVPYTVEVTVVGEADDVSGAIRTNSILVTQADAVPASAAELVQRARDDVARVIAVLYATAHYGGSVTITLAGVPAESAGAEAAVAAAAARGPVPVTIAADPGPLFTFGRIVIRGLPPGEVDRSTVPLVEGEPATAQTVRDAEAEIVRQLREQGYPLAAVPGREAVADHRTDTLDVTLTVDAGGQAVMGPPQVSGAVDVDPEFVTWLSTYQPGELYDPRKLDEYRARLRRLEVFSSVVVRTGDAIDASGTIPVIVEVKERKPRTVGAGAFFSTTDGVTLNAFWMHRNLFGHAEQLRFEGEASRLFQDTLLESDYRLAAKFTKPGIITPDDDLLASMTLEQEHPDAYERQAFNTDVRIRRRLSDRLSVEAGVEAEVSKVEDFFGQHEYVLVGIPIAANYDSSNDRLNPTEGIRASLSAEPMVNLEGGTTFFAIARGSFSTYRALDEASRFVVAGRVAAGTIVGADRDDLPADRRFYAGGGGSIRGYGYQQASPRVSGQIVGGLSLLEASLELRIKVTEKLGFVPFIDVGRAFDEPFPDFGDLKVGAGIGLRYDTPIGPIRADVAFPLNREPGDAGYGVYIGLGQAF